jgi:hypothetical protein
MVDRRLGGIVLTAAGLALCLLRFLLPLGSPPLYDGILLPPEPYRYLHPTPKQARNNLPPTSARATVPAQNPPYISIATAERPPQAGVVLTGSAFRVPPGIRQVTITVRAVSPPPLPRGLTLAGNVYAIRATANGRPVSLRPGHASVILRAVSNYAHPVMEEYSAGAWRALHASPGYNIATWGAQLTAFGDVALMVHGKSLHSPGPPFAPLLIAGLVTVLVVALALILLRRSRASGVASPAGQ